MIVSPISFLGQSRDWELCCAESSDLVLEGPYLIALRIDFRVEIPSTENRNIQREVLL